jgi:vacuolar-type H+-ATPase subunit I/STV1
MIRIAFSLLLLGLLGGAAWAEIYRCRDADGVLVFTDDPAHFPPGCKEEESKGRTGGLTVIPESPVQPVAPVAEELLREKALQDEERKQKVQEWSEEAATLVQEYQQALSQRFHTTIVAERQKYLDRIREIKERRDEILKELAEARLSSREREDIEKTLSTIPP